MTPERLSTIAVPDIDHFVIQHMIDRYGRNGEKLWAAEPAQPAADS
jgi:hypothetical protein